MLKNSPKILICGLGSIGQRHATILRDKLSCEVVAFRSGEQSNENNLGISEVNTWKDAINSNCDVAVISNPSNLHIDTATKCAKSGMSIFIEKPIDAGLAGLDELMQIVEENNITSYVAYVMRFHPLVARIKNDLENDKVVSARFVSASYLPEWRPGTKHKQSYSSQSSMGGGVVLDLSHELDLARYLIGEVKSIIGISDRRGDITVDSEDIADLLIEHASCTSNVHLSYCSRISQRTIDIETSSKTIHANLLSGDYIVSSADRTIECNIAINKNEIFLKQWEYFLENINNKRMQNNLFEARALFEKIISFKESR